MSHRSKTALQRAHAEGASGCGLLGAMKGILFGPTGPRGGQRDELVQTAAKGAVRTIGAQVGKEILRGVLGGILGGGKRR